MALYLSQRWRSQPQCAVTIAGDWNQWVLRAVLPSLFYGFDIVTRRFASVGTPPTIALSPTGTGLYYTANAAPIVFSGTPIANMDDGYALLVVAAPVAAATISAPIYIGNESGAGNNQSSLLFNSTFDAVASSGSFALVEYSSGFKSTGHCANVIDGNSHVFMGVKRNTASVPILYVDGVSKTLVNSTANTGTTFLDGVSVGSMPTTTTRYMRAPLTLAALFKNGVSAGMARELAINPWQIFQPLSARIYSFPAAAGGSTVPVLYRQRQMQGMAS